MGFRFKDGSMAPAENHHGAVASPNSSTKKTDHRITSRTQPRAYWRHARPNRQAV